MKRHPIYNPLYDRVVAALIALVFLFAISAGVSGCRSSGGGDYRSATRAGRWPQFLAGQPARVSLALPDQAQTDVRAGFQDWTAATGGRVKWEFVGPDQPAEVTVTAGQNAHGVGGWTRSYRDCGDQGADGLMLRSDVVLDLGQIVRLRDVARHEAGHVAGIIDHSPRKGDTMYGPGPYPAIGGRDVRTLAKIYGISLP